MVIGETIGDPPENKKKPVTIVATDFFMVESTQKCSNPLRKKIGVCASHTDKAFPHFCCNRIVFNMCFRVIHAIH